MNLTYEVTGLEVGQASRIPMSLALRAVRERLPTAEHDVQLKCAKLMFTDALAQEVLEVIIRDDGVAIALAHFLPEETEEGVRITAVHTYIAPTHRVPELIRVIRSAHRAAADHVLRMSPGVQRVQLEWCNSNGVDRQETREKQNG